MTHRLRKPGRPRRLLLYASILLLCLSGCGELDLRVSAARELLDEGNYDQAFEAYERLYQEGVRRPQVLSGLGLILTLQPTSVFAGIDLLETALAEESDEELREELMLLYLALGRIDLARALIHPDRLSVEQVYGPGITRLRLGLSCLNNPGARALATLKELPEHPRRDFFIFLCEVEEARRSRPVPGAIQESQMPALLESWQNLNTIDARMACESLAVWPQSEAGVSEQAAAASTERSLPAELADAWRQCRDQFASVVAIQRERPDLRVADGPAAGERRFRTLFDLDVFEPGDPGAESEPRRYRPPPPDAGTQSGPFTPIP